MRMTRHATATPVLNVEHYLERHHVRFDLQEHPEAYRAKEVAHCEGIAPEQFAKVVVVLADARPYMLVLPASKYVELAGLGRRLGLGETVVQLADQSEIVRLFPDCDRGAVPPFGPRYGIPVYIDPDLAKQGSVVFNAGTHTATIRISYADLVRIADPRVFAPTAD